MLTPQLLRLRRTALMVGMAALALTAVGIFLGREQFFQSYLYGFLFWVGLSLGCLFLLMLTHVAGGSWGAMIRRPLEAGVMVLPTMALFFIPLLFGISNLYEWARPEVVAANPVLQAKAGYLNMPFFTARALLYFVVWLTLGLLLYRWSAKQDEQPDGSAIFSRMRRLSGPGIVLYILTMTFAAFDWGMSLEPEWFSGIYGVIFMIGQAISAVALIIIVTVSLSGTKPMSEVATWKRVQDLGNLLMAMTMFWAYVSVSQLIIIWSGNVAETASWYVLRLNNPDWQPLALFLALFHFFVPFFILFSRWVKRQGRALMLVAGWMILMRFVDIFWIIVPAFEREGFPLHWLDLSVAVGIGGIWLAVFLSRLIGKPLLPLRDPRLPLAEGATQHG